MATRRTEEEYEALPKDKRKAVADTFEPSQEARKREQELSAAAEIRALRKDLRTGAGLFVGYKLLTSPLGKNIRALGGLAALVVVVIAIQIVTLTGMVAALAALWAWKSHWPMALLLGGANIWAIWWLLKNGKRKRK